MQVGFGKDFQASRNIDNDVGKNFRLLGSFLSEAVKRSGSPLRQFSRSPVCIAPSSLNNGPASVELLSQEVLSKSLVATLYAGLWIAIVARVTSKKAGKPGEVQ